MFNDIIDSFVRFTGTGWFIWALVCVCLAIICVRDKSNRNGIVYPVLLFFAFYFNPIVYKILGMNFMRGVYWRLLWVVPIPVIIATGMVCIYDVFKNRLFKFLTLIIICVIIVILGKNIYTKNNFITPQNEYHIPQYVIDVSNAILEDEEYEYKMAIVPNEMLCYIRQYTSKINLLYGRNAYGYIGSIGHDEKYVHQQMSSPDIENLDTISRISDRKGCNYIVFSSVNHKNYKSIEEYRYYVFYKSVAGYDIYKKTSGWEGY